jgi:hypothetical protein
MTPTDTEIEKRVIVIVWVVYILAMATLVAYTVRTTRIRNLMDDEQYQTKRCIDSAVKYFFPLKHPNFKLYSDSAKYHSARFDSLYKEHDKIKFMP